ncbi:hypothetical protein OS493_032793 [Desmophyllum pertusum]|uniref:Uncharacterized protein n=1 Tax=Desmophyllum pertusum TaxID=174260 RepID=A0A9X0CWB4_9CNID|nr:hypothetical protein OS493_032793 [Desmophyllum pertusum]
MAAWIKLNEKVRAKRTKKDPPKDHRRRPKGEELTVQRLSAEVAGKAQKYTRVGPREFVPFDEDEEMTIGNIKNGGDGDTNTSMIRKRKINVDTQSSMSTDFLPPQPKTRSSPSKLMQPKQQLPACTNMLKLGKINNETATKIVKIFKFDMERLSWSKVATTVELYEERGPIGTGGFRKAFKATSKHAEFIATTHVSGRVVHNFVNMRIVQIHAPLRMNLGLIQLNTAPLVPSGEEKDALVLHVTPTRAIMAPPIRLTKMEIVQSHAVHLRKHPGLIQLNTAPSVPSREEKDALVLHVTPTRAVNVTINSSSNSNSSRLNKTSELSNEQIKEILAANNCPLVTYDEETDSF